MIQNYDDLDSFLKLTFFSVLSRPFKPDELLFIEAVVKARNNRQMLYMNS